MGRGAGAAAEAVTPEGHSDHGLSAPGAGDGPLGAANPLTASTRRHAADGTRLVYVVHPSLGRGPDVLIAKALKACFFEAIPNSDKRRSAGRTMPPVAYIADEFHRFVTSDRTHGEQSFLDTCRSFGAFCVLACQTISSLHHALAENGDPSASNGPAVSMVVTDTGTKLIVRSTDPETNAYVAELCPGTPEDARSPRSGRCPRWPPASATRSRPAGASSDASSIPARPSARPARKCRSGRWCRSLPRGRGGPIPF